MSIKLTAPETYTATIGGLEWSGITSASRFWAEVQKRIAADEEVIDMTTPTAEQTHAAQIAAINAERDRRLAADFTFQGKAYQRDAVSVSRITGAATLAGFALAQGAQPDDYNWHGGDAPFAWIASDNSLTLMDAQTCFAFGAECAAIETRIVFAAKMLRDAEVIPADFADDQYWP